MHLIIPSLTLSFIQSTHVSRGHAYEVYYFQQKWKFLGVLGELVNRSLRSRLA